MKIVHSITAIAIALGLTSCATPAVTQGYQTYYANPVCEFTVFEGKTFDRSHQIKICMKSEQRQNYMEFHYDIAGELAQRPLRVKAGNVVWEHIDMPNSSYDKLIVGEGKTGMSVLRLLQGGILSGKLMVTEGGKEKIFILDPSTIRMSITHDGHSLSDYDVVPSIRNTNRINLGRALAPEGL